jgi:phytanoyl-CoA hydroxylase
MPYIDPAQSAKILPPLHVNDGPLKPENVGYLRTTPKETPIDEVRQRLQEDGYVLLKGILPRQDVLTAREAYFKHLAPSGVLKPDTAAVEGIFDDAKDKLHYPGIGAGVLDRRDNPSNPTARFIDLAISAHDEPWYKQDLCRHPDLIGFISRLTGWGENTLALQRTLLRNNTPGNKAIGVHYDQIFLRHGDDTVLTAWVPVGDVQLNGGGLIYLENGE